MDIEQLIEEINLHLDDLMVFSFNDDITDAIMNRHGDVDDEEEELRTVGENAENKKAACSRLTKLFQALRDHKDQDQFWDFLGSNGKSPGIFQVFCYSLLKYSSHTRKIGSLIYATLLGMTPLSLLWNNRIFNQILSIMVTGTQALDRDTAMTDDESKAIVLTGELLDVLSYALTKSFQKLAGTEVVIALIEIAVKICTIWQKMHDRYHHSCSQHAWKFLKKAAELFLSFTLPAIVLVLLLDFLPAGKQVSAPVVQIRDEFLEFCSEHLQDDDLELVAKHILLRCPDRQALRDNATHVVSCLAKMMKNSDSLVMFIVKASRDKKGILRMLALDVFRRLIVDNDFQLKEEFELEMVKKINLGIRDTSPGVRAAALTVIAALIPEVIEHNAKAVAEGIGLAPIGDDDSNVERFIDSLKVRIIDEKLNVRKATLKCLRAVIDVNDNDTLLMDILNMVAERTRDRSVIVRQEAMNVMSFSLRKFDTLEVRRLWFDNVLPMAMDIDTRTQDMALKNIDNCLMGDGGVDRAIDMTPSHIDLMSKVVRVFVQKSYSLSSFCKAVEKRLATDCDPIFWKLENIIVSAAPTHMKKNFIKLWDDRYDLPVEYLAIVSKSAQKNDAVLEDAIQFLREIANGDRTEALFGAIHWMVSIMTGFGEDYGEEVMRQTTTLTDRLNEAASNEMLVQEDMINLIPSIFLLGELLEYCTSLRDFDFTGLQLMISEKLPNCVTIPETVRATAAISLGKLCLWRRDISSNFVGAFVSQLHVNKNAAVKCNCLVTLCDLCVKYSATVDPYVMPMSACIGDADPSVRRQALLIMTKLITEDYLKMKQLVFFRFVTALVDPDKEVAMFAQSCLFDVINAKDQRLMADHFINALLYFNGFLNTRDDGESDEERKLFEMKNHAKRRKAFTMMLSRMSSTVLFRLLQSTCTQILQEYLDEHKDLDAGESLLSDTLYIMMKIEDEMDDVNSTESSATDDPKTEKIVNDSKVLVNVIHDQLIHRVLPILNQMHRYLRSNNSPLQSNLRNFFRKLCQKHKNLLDELKKQEPLLAEELEHDITMIQTPLLETPPRMDVTPPQTPFRSPLLVRIARNTPRPELPAVPTVPNSPLSVLSQSSQVMGDDEDSLSQKRPPIPFTLED